MKLLKKISMKGKPARFETILIQKLGFERMFWLVKAFGITESVTEIGV